MNMLTAVLLFLVTSVVTAAPTVVWDASAGADGYKIYVEPTPVAGSPTMTDVGNVLVFDLGPQVQIGTEYEIWVTAYATDPAIPDSADSNHIRLTPPAAPQVVTIPSPPSTIQIQFQ